MLITPVAGTFLQCLGSLMLYVGVLITLPFWFHLQATAYLMLTGEMSDNGELPRLRTIPGDRGPA